jgi:hypothetical protein
MPRKRVLEVATHHAGTHPNRPVFEVEVDDSVEPAKVEDQGVGSRQGRTCDRRTATPRNDRHTLLGGPDQDPDDIVRRDWAGNRLRHTQIDPCLQPFDGQRPRIHSVEHTEIQSIVDQATKLVPTGVYPVRVQLAYHLIERSHTKQREAL